MKEDLLVIVGPTAVGKTKLSIELARQFCGEIISGDSMQVYCHMDIGTAKASPAERAEVPHHLIDFLDPASSFSVEEFQQLTRKKITQIQERNRLPMLVGGTGLYIQAVTHGYRFPGVEADPDFRQAMNDLAEREGNEALLEKLRKVDPEAAARLHPNNRRRVIRALEVIHTTGQPFSQLVSKENQSPYHLLWIGLTMPREMLYQRIEERVEQMVADGLVDEVARLREMGYNRELQSMQALGYKEIMDYLDGDLSLEEAIDQMKQGTRKYAKRQLSWFRRLKEINWFDVTNPEIGKEIQQLVAGNFPSYRE